MENRPRVRNVVSFYVRKRSITSRAQMDMCCPDPSRHESECLGCFADHVIEKEHYREDEHGDLQQMPIWVEEESAHVLTQELAFDFHDSKAKGEVASAWTLRVSLGGLPGASEQKQRKSYYFVRTILAFRFNPGDDWLSQHPHQALLPIRPNRGPVGDFWKFYQKYEGDHLVAPGASEVVPFGRSSCLCGAIMGAVRSEHLRRDWLRRKAGKFTAWAKARREELEVAFRTAHGKQKGTKRTLAQIREQYVRKPPAERPSYFKEKYGVEVPEKPFFTPVPKHLWKHWASEEPGRYWKEKARVDSVEFPGLPERFLRNGARRDWGEKEALEFLQDVCSLGDWAKEKPPPPAPRPCSSEI